MHHGEVRLALVIGLDRFDRGNFPRESQVHNVGPGLRPEPHLVARAQLHAKNADTVLPLGPLQVVPLELVHEQSTFPQIG